jgi:hypothetical protein
MTAPARKAWFGDAIGGKEEVEDVASERNLIIERLADLANWFPDWIAEETGTEVHLTVREREPGRSVIAWTGGRHEGTVTFTADPSGWILVVAEQQGRETWRGYLDHPYEAYEIFPPGAIAETGDEAPGHIGKKMHWVSLSTTAWPQLKGPARGSGGFNLEIDESKLRES